MTIDRLIEDLQHVKSRIGGECEVRVTNVGVSCVPGNILMHVESVLRARIPARDDIAEIFVTEITRA